MKRVIFSIHIDLESKKLDKQLGPYWAWEVEDRSTKTKRVMNEYSEMLINNKQNYANLHNCDYFHYTNGKDYEQFRDLMYSYCQEQNEYHVVNFYKLWKMEKLSEEYEEVLYVDFDVLFETGENFFEEHDLNKGIHVHLEDYHEEALKYVARWSNEKLYLRSMINKYFIAHALCSHDFMSPRVPITNTGIIGASRKHIKQLDYFKNLEEILNNITFFKTDPDSMYTDNIKETMDYNNEPIYSYLLAKNNVPSVNINGPWHRILDHTVENRKQYLSLDRKMTHFITKRFEWHYNTD